MSDRYRVSWVIDVDCEDVESPRDAAVFAERYVESDDHLPWVYFVEPLDVDGNVCGKAVTVEMEARTA